MFAKATDFNKHIKCCERIQALIEVQPDQMMEILDILFKWTNLRITESTNTQLLKSVYDLYTGLIDLMVERDYTMAEFEALVLIGTLCDKSGHNIAQMKDAAKELIRKCFAVYEDKNVFRIIINAGIKSQTN
jgi:cytoskeleton-associated protein 5